MPASNMSVRSGPIALPSAVGGSRASSVVAFGCVLVVVAVFCCYPSLFAQTSDSVTVGEPNKSWIATTDFKSDNLLPTRIPVRIIESHSQNGNRTIDERSIQIQGVDGHLEPYQEIERETLQLDANNVRTITRMFDRDANGAKSLVQVTNEEKHSLPSGDSTVLRTTFNSDVNGKLQPGQHEMVETKTISKDVEETKTTVMVPSINGGLAPLVKTLEVRKRGANDTVETEKSTWLPDLNGNWQISEIRKDVTKQEANHRVTEERVSRPDAEGKLDEVSRVVSQESEGSSGEKRNSVETYSMDVPGSPRDGNLHAVERTTGTERSSSTGERTTEQTVEQLNPGDPGAGLRVSALVDGRMVPGPSGEQSTVTIRARDSNGSFGVVSVDTTRSDRIPTIQVQQTPAEMPY